jgi:prolyl-tRNA synthetase
MRLSHLFARTLRQVPAEADSVSHQLLLRAGLAAPIAAGVYAYLPLGLEVMRRIQGILREEMERTGPDGRFGQELLMPSLLPIDVYQASGRDRRWAISCSGSDHRRRDFVLGPTHEEVFIKVFKRQVQSYAICRCCCTRSLEVPR